MTDRDPCGNGGPGGSTMREAEVEARTVRRAAPPVVFLHSMWRARSTWLFRRFRETGGFRCYYEPLNEHLGQLTPGQVRGDALEVPHRRAGMRHPELAGGYWSEYADRVGPIGSGVAGYRRRFAFHPFDAGNDPAPYLRALISAAGGRPVVLKLCRSPFRLRWLVDRFPDAAHYYLERDVERQYASYAVCPAYFLPTHLAYARIQPGLGGRVAHGLPELMPSHWRSFAWRVAFDAWRSRASRSAFEEWQRHFSIALGRARESHRYAAFRLLWEAARDDAVRAGLSFVDMEDPGSIGAAFREYGLAIEDFRDGAGDEAGDPVELGPPVASGGRARLSDAT